MLVFIKKLGLLFLTESGEGVQTEAGEDILLG